MSLILDALRKSEAERRRGQAPSLYSGMPVLTTRQRPSWLRVLPWVVAGVLVLVALFAFRHDDEPATRTEPEQAADADAAATFAAPVLPAPPAATAPPASPRAFPPAAAPPVDALVKPPTSATASVPASIPAPAPLPAATAPVANEAPPPDTEALPPLTVLDAATLAALPPMKLSMHVYNSEAARRFAIIDGQRVTEGTQLGAAVVTEIRRDGVVLEIGGRHVLLPRP